MCASDNSLANVFRNSMSLYLLYLHFGSNSKKIRKNRYITPTNSKIFSPKLLLYNALTLLDIMNVMMFGVDFYILEI